MEDCTHRGGDRCCWELMLTIDSGETVHKVSTMWPDCNRSCYHQSYVRHGLHKFALSLWTQIFIFIFKKEWGLSQNRWLKSFNKRTLVHKQMLIILQCLEGRQVVSESSNVLEEATVNGRLLTRIYLKNSHVISKPLAPPEIILQTRTNVPRSTPTFQHAS